MQRDDDDLVVIGDILTVRQEAFCQAFADPDSLTWHNASKSGRAAGYAHKSAPGKLMQLQKIRTRIIDLTETHAERVCQTPSTVLLSLDRLRIAAEEKGDLPTALRATELLGKTMAMFTDRTALDVPQEGRQLSDKEREEAVRIANIRLRQQLYEQDGDDEHGRATA